MEQDSFYLFLPSNTLSNNPSNPDTLSAYRTTLNKPLDLRHGSWEVGLAEASYPINIYNVGEPIYVGLVRYSRQLEVEIIPTVDVKIVTGFDRADLYHYHHSSLGKMEGVDDGDIRDPNYLVVSEGNQTSVDEILKKMTSQLVLLKAGEQKELNEMMESVPPSNDRNRWQDKESACYYAQSYS